MSDALSIAVTLVPAAAIVFLRFWLCFAGQMEWVPVSSKVCRRANRTCRHRGVRCVRRRS